MAKKKWHQLLLRQFWLMKVGTLLGILSIGIFAGSQQLYSVELTASEGFFIDSRGRKVLLRGVNIAGNSKVPPFIPFRDPSHFDRLKSLGFNVIRLMFTWEAYEPKQGQYDHAYLEQLKKLARSASERGIFTIVDFHQDGFSRSLSGGCGDGFPLWAVPESLRQIEPRNDHRCVNWIFSMVTDRNMHRAFKAFYDNENQLYDRYVALMTHLADEFRSVPGVIGFDIINEPWGCEKSQLSRLYSDTVTAMRRVDPDFIAFLEPMFLKYTGLVQTALPKPTFGNVAYAPHFYDLAVMTTKRWLTKSVLIDRAFKTMDQLSKQWDVPLFVGEFGAFANTQGGLRFIDTNYQAMDDYFASGTQWNYTPQWNPQDFDGWNGEDLSIIDDQGELRDNFVQRPRFLAVAGTPVAFKVSGDPGNWSEFTAEWHHDPNAGATEIYIPFKLGRIEASDGLGCQTLPYDGWQTISCQADKEASVRIKVVR